MKPYIGTSQTFVFMSVRASSSEKAKTLAYEIL